MRAEASGEEGILGWHRRATSAYTWCVTEKGPQRRWLHKLGKEDTPGCHCQSQLQSEVSGKHTVEECEVLTGLRKVENRTESGGVANTPLERQREGKNRKRKMNKKGRKLRVFV